MEQSTINECIALKWFDAFNRHDLEALLSFYDDQAEHFSPKLKTKLPETNGFIQGKDALRAWWKDSFERLPNLHYQVQKLTANDERIFMEYLRKVESESDMMVGEVLEIQGEKIIASRVYHG